jgi:predicted ATP-dependent endonuclease of OLD family
LKIVKATIEGFKRFLEPTSLVFNGSVTAVVGPNEAGKSSLLAALEQFTAVTGMEKSAKTRGTDATSKVTVIYELEDEDAEAIRHIPGSEQIRAMQLSAFEQSWDWTFYPQSPTRNLEDRERLLEGLEQATQQLFARFQLGPTFEALRAGAVNTLKSDETLSTIELDALTSFSQLVRSIVENQEPNEPEDDSLAAVRGTYATQLAAWREMNSLADELDVLAGNESQDEPSHQVGKVLLDRIPRFLKFGQADRELKPEYTVEMLRQGVPAALANFLALCDHFELANYFKAVDDGDDTMRKQLEKKANDSLKEKFTERWSQSRLSLELELGTERIVIYVRPEDGSDFARFDERSDGLRIFVALLAFIWNSSKRPILMLDEVETHLHYDAQAELIDILHKQDFTSHVIYTTHSVGCLPLDLGGAIRAIKTTGDQRSQIVSNVWQGQAGFRPLMAAMGAAAISFTPSRFALLGEGVSESMLLPTLFRQEVDGHEIEFQVAPGLASLSESHALQLDTEAGAVAYLVDGDSAGDKIRQRLLTLGIPGSKILSLADYGGDGTVLEDLVDLDRYIDAARAEISLWSDSDPHELRKDDFQSGYDAPGQLNAWCIKHGLRTPDKLRVIGRLLDMADAERVRRLKMNSQESDPFLISSTSDQIGALRSAAESALGLGHSVSSG